MEVFVRDIPLSTLDDALYVFITTHCAWMVEAHPSPYLFQVSMLCVSNFLGYLVEPSTFSRLCSRTLSVLMLCGRAVAQSG